LDDLRPKRFGLKYNPPTLILEYLVPSTGKLFHRRMCLKATKIKKMDPQRVAEKLKEKNPLYLADDKIRFDQVVELVAKLCKNVVVGTATSSLPTDGAAHEEDKQGAASSACSTPPSRRRPPTNTSTFITTGDEKKEESEEYSETRHTREGALFTPGTKPADDHLATNTTSTLESDEERQEVVNHHRSKRLQPESETGDNRNIDDPDPIHMMASAGVPPEEEKEDDAYDGEFEVDSGMDMDSLDLNKLTEEEIAMHKKHMDTEFFQNRKAPGDPDFVYDVRVDFPPPKFASDWD